MPSRRPRGFTLVELLVLVLLLALLTGVVLRLVVRTHHHEGGRVRCASNLRQIGQALQMYANDFGGQFPRVAYDGAGGPPAEYTAPLAPNPFGPGGPAPNDVTAALFLLVRTQDLTPEVFVCHNVKYAQPWDFGGGGRTAQQTSNFPGRQFITYSFANPYAAPEVEKGGFNRTITSSSEFAIAADMNPGGPAVTEVTPTSPRQRMSAANSPNHNGDGQNVLYADGHVEFQNTPFCGVLRTTRPGGQFRDNIYTFGVSPGAGVRGPPADAIDSVLLPTALDGPAPVPPAKWKTPLLAVLAAAAALLLWFLRRRRLAAQRTLPAAP